jgi:hypothetical protein
MIWKEIITPLTSATSVGHPPLLHESGHGPSAGCSSSWSVHIPAGSWHVGDSQQGSSWHHGYQVCVLRSVLLEFWELSMFDIVSIFWAWTYVLWYWHVTWEKSLQDNSWIYLWLLSVFLLKARRGQWSVDAYLSWWNFWLIRTFMFGPKLLEL